MKRSIIGYTRKIQTAILVCEFLRDKFCQPHSIVARDLVKYEIAVAEPPNKNGQWIYVDGDLDQQLTTRFVEICCAFVAGAGEVW